MKYPEQRQSKLIFIMELSIDLNGGRHLSPEEKKLMVRLKQYFDCNRSEFGAKAAHYPQIGHSLSDGCQQPCFEKNAWPKPNVVKIKIFIR